VSVNGRVRRHSSLDIYQDEDAAINRATLTKFGFKVGELTVFFKRN
jgi:hypothetical protein